MAEEQISKSEPQRAPYVKPAILTLKVNLSFASSATDLDHWFGSIDRSFLAETETRQRKAKAAVAQRKNQP